MPTLLAGGCLLFPLLSLAETVLPKEVQPILQKYCSDCHADGANKGNVSFDQFKNAEELMEPELWAKALKNVRAGMMPPPKKDQPSAEEKAQLEKWIKQAVFKIDANNPDPGRVVVRRLNRAEYRNTIRDLTGVDFNTEAEFPADDSGHGFDNMASVLTLSPMLMEKYLDAAKLIVSQTVPVTSGVAAERFLDLKGFQASSGNSRNEAVSLSYYDPATVSNKFQIHHDGKYELVINLTAAERHVENQFDYNKSRLTIRLDGEEVLRREFNREGGKAFNFNFPRDWKAGEHTVSFQVEPLTTEKQIRSLSFRINSLVVKGPMIESHFVKPKNYERWFARPVPKDAPGRQAYSGDILRGFAEKAFRVPVDEATVNRLISLAEHTSNRPGNTFESGIAQAMAAILTSPRFLFREDQTVQNSTSERFPLVNDFSLASRLSYFLWSSMPDEELFTLARKGELRKNLPAQVTRMLADTRSREFVRNFSGQWLQTRDVDSVQINSRAVNNRERAPSDQPRGFGRRGPNGPELDNELRRAMRSETEMYFARILREDRSVLELIDSNYTFLNERLASHYGLTNLNVKGSDLRLVSLPEGSARGGILTHGSVLVVTSNPTRTSPVKRGMFVLENILGTPPPPPPPDIPTLEEAGEGNKDRKLSLRESLELHRKNPTCSSCHNRMDPLGLAFENFNALGAFRTNELGQEIQIAGTLISGESFSSIQEMKRILATRHAELFYHTMVEKLLTYALGRGLEYYDVEAVDRIVQNVKKADGRFSAALTGVIESAPFQRTRAIEFSVPSSPKTKQASN